MVKRQRHTSTTIQWSSTGLSSLIIWCHSKCGHGIFYIVNRCSIFIKYILTPNRDEGLAFRQPLWTCELCSLEMCSRTPRPSTSPRRWVASSPPCWYDMTPTPLALKGCPSLSVRKQEHQMALTLTLGPGRWWTFHSPSQLRSRDNPSAEWASGIKAEKQAGDGELFIVPVLFFLASWVPAVGFHKAYPYPSSQFAVSFYTRWHLR